MHLVNNSIVRIYLKIITRFRRHSKLECVPCIFISLIKTHTETHKTNEFFRLLQTNKNLYKYKIYKK